MDATDILRENFPVLIPILALMIPIVAIVAHYLTKSRREQAMHETIRELVKAGQPIPPQLLSGKEFQDSDLEEQRSQRQRNAGLQAGVINLSIGLGLMGMFAAMRPGSWLWSIGLIPFCLGLGLMLLWGFERKQQQQQQINR